jgi:hypothetical protein
MVVSLVERQHRLKNEEHVYLFNPKRHPFSFIDLLNIPGGGIVILPRILLTSFSIRISDKG